MIQKYSSPENNITLSLLKNKMAAIYSVYCYQIVLSHGFIRNQLQKQNQGALYKIQIFLNFNGLNSTCFLKKLLK